jgi:hypothetical protein
MNFARIRLWPSRLPNAATPVARWPARSTETGITHDWLYSQLGRLPRTCQG